MKRLAVMAAVSLHYAGLVAASDVSLRMQEIPSVEEYQTVSNIGFVTHKPDTIYMVNHKGKLFLFNLGTRQLIHETLPDNLNIGDPAWSPNGKLLAFHPLKDMSLYVYDFSTGGTHAIFRAQDEYGGHIAWRDDNELFYSLPSGVHLVNIGQQSAVRLFGPIRDWVTVSDFVEQNQQMMYFTRIEYKSGIGTQIKTAQIRNGKISKARTIIDATMASDTIPRVTGDGKLMVFTGDSTDPHVGDEAPVHSIYLLDSATGCYVSASGGGNWSDEIVAINRDGSALVAASRRTDKKDFVETDRGMDLVRYHARYARIDRRLILRSIAEHCNGSRH